MTEGGTKRETDSREHCTLEIVSIWEDKQKEMDMLLSGAPAQAKDAIIKRTGTHRMWGVRYIQVIGPGIPALRRGSL